MNAEYSGALLDRPQVNAKAPAARIEPDDPGVVIRAGSTAGASSTLAVLPGAWPAYTADAGVLARSFGEKPQGEITGLAVFPGASHMLTDPGAQETEDTGDVRTFFFTRDLSIHEYVPPASKLHELALVNVDPAQAYRAARRNLVGSRDVVLGHFRRRLDKARAEYAQRPPSEVVSEMSDELGVSQLVIAQAVGVSPTAVRKWRRGDASRPDHRDRLARLAALARVLQDVGLHDPASWIEMPISDESTLTPLDVFRARRPELILLLAAGLADPQETLDAFDPSWRTNSARDPDYEVVTLADGTRSVVPRRG